MEFKEPVKGNCIECGKLFIDKSSTKKRKYCSSKCRWRHFEKSEKGRKYRKEYGKWRRTTIEGRYNHYKSSAKEKGRDFKLSKEEFEKLVSLPCFYCNFSGKTGIIQKMGLDRIDNNKGYLINNVVPCCTLCNMTRSNNFTKDEFILIGKVIKKIREMRRN